MLATGVWVLSRGVALPDRPRLIVHARVGTGRNVHLAGDMDVAAWRARVPGLLGYSAHSRAEADAAFAAGADYVFLSPVFEARHGRPPIGVADLRGCLALGGVTLDRVARCMDAGAAGVAVAGAIFDTPDPAAAARAFVQKVQTSGS
ncbi:MAG: thiamine phosphate synthase [Myxococcota bacterium]